MRVAVISLFVLSTLAVAEQSDQFSLAGTVVNEKTGEPIKRALVHVDCAAPLHTAAGRQPGMNSHQLMTDDAGLFQLKLSEPARCNIRAEKPAFAMATTAPIAMLEVTHSIDGIRVTLSPLGVITGKVTDQSGEPVANVRVWAISTSIEDGYRKARRQRNVLTDDRGVYRFWNLSPGRYYIKAVGRNGTTNSYVGDTTPNYVATESFRAVYSDGAFDLDAAHPLTTAAGESAQADIHIGMEPAFKIAGILNNIQPGKPVEFQLRNNDEEGPPSRVSLNSTTGRFEIQDVITGRYGLRVTQDKTWAEAGVEVKDGSLEGISLALSPGASIRMTSHYSGQPPEIYARRQVNPDLPCAAQLHPVGNLSGQSYNLQNGVLPDLPPDRYRLALKCALGYVESARRGEQDLLADPVINVAGASDPAIEIAAVFGGGVVRAALPPGAVSDHAVLLVPVLNAHSQAQIADPYLRARESILFSNLRPGLYHLFVLPHGDIEFHNPEFLDHLTGGVEVQVTDGGKSEVTLEVRDK